jgi:ABC-type spermidine/putrescine transport system permease subunit I
MIGVLIQNFYLVQHRYTVASAMSVILMISMLVLAVAYARVLGTEDDTIAQAAA